MPLSWTHLTDWSIYADLPSFPSPSLISGDTFRPDLILHNKHSKKVHILELKVGFESNLKINSDRKLSKHMPLVCSLSPSYQDVNFISVPMSVLGILDNYCVSLLQLLKDLNVKEIHQKRLASKIITIAICSTYYTFFRRNKDWKDPDLMDVQPFLPGHADHFYFFCFPNRTIWLPLFNGIVQALT